MSNNIIRQPPLQCVGVNGINGSTVKNAVMLNNQIVIEFTDGTYLYITGYDEIECSSPSSVRFFYKDEFDELGWEWDGINGGLTEE